MLSETANNRCRCPVCGAGQDWSTECRRCTADLELLRSVAEVALVSKRSCVLSIAAGRYRDALAFAKDLNRLRPDDEGKRLLAVCYLMCHDFNSATALAK